jgi:hypothetical protein
VIFSKRGTTNATHVWCSPAVHNAIPHDDLLEWIGDFRGKILPKRIATRQGNAQKNRIFKEKLDAVVHMGKEVEERAAIVAAREAAMKKREEDFQRMLDEKEARFGAMGGSNGSD